jgi:hypothetical protein
MPGDTQLPALRPQRADTIKAARNRKNRTCANHVAVPAIPANPKIPAMIPRIKKVMDQTQPVIFYPLFHLQNRAKNNF